MKHVTLKPGREKALLQRHLWVFSGAVQSMPEGEDGAFLPVQSSQGEFLGTGYFHRKSSIIGRMVTFDKRPPVEAISDHIDRAIAFRDSLFDPKKTNAYRLINGEGDSLPGLIVDRYGDVLVVQFTTLGMDLIRDKIVAFLSSKLHPRTIYEKSTGPSRREEGLEDQQGVLFGEEMRETEVLENGLKFLVPIVEGQKTGLFLDHREMRALVQTLSKDKRVLNAFSYTGGFSVYALAGGATSAVSLDISEKALEIASRNSSLNHFLNHRSETADVFDYLRQNELAYDLVILDPPAFAKRKKDIVTACRGYKDINRLAMQKMPPKSLLLTASCSYFVNAELFQKVVFQAALEAKRTVRIIGRHRLAADHPINICHPEGDYLKSLLLYIE